jgi:hypothetical protein
VKRDGNRSLRDDAVRYAPYMVASWCPHDEPSSGLGLELLRARRIE